MFLLPMLDLANKMRSVRSSNLELETALERLMVSVCLTLNLSKNLFKLETVLNQGHYTNEQFATAIDGLNWHGKLTAINCGVQAGLDQLDTTDNVNDVLIGKLFSTIHLS